LQSTEFGFWLRNIGGFPYKAETKDGGAFVLIYLLCMVTIGVPIMIIEIIIGTRAGNSPINARKRTSMQSNTSSLWKLI
jgi:Na+-dependent transporters of the SNF family